MRHFEVYQELQSTTKQTFIVEAENEDQAWDGLTNNNFVSETTETAKGAPPLYREVHEISEEKAQEIRSKHEPDISGWMDEEGDVFVVSGVYTDTEDLQPFTFNIRAEAPERALALVAAGGQGHGMDNTDAVAKAQEILDGGGMDLDLSQGEIRPVSVRRYGSEQELLHTIDEFA